MKLRTLMAGAVGAMLLGGAASAGDDNDIYHDPYTMCQKIVTYQFRLSAITEVNRAKAIQNCLSHTTHYF